MQAINTILGGVCGHVISGKILEFTSRYSDYEMDHTKLEFCWNDDCVKRLKYHDYVPWLSTCGSQASRSVATFWNKWTAPELASCTLRDLANGRNYIQNRNHIVSSLFAFCVLCQVNCQTTASLTDFKSHIMLEKCKVYIMCMHVMHIILYACITIVCTMYDILATLYMQSWKTPQILVRQYMFSGFPRQNWRRGGGGRGMGGA